MSVRSLLDIVNQSLRTLWAHKLRSFLTMFGIAWGVGSLLLLVGLGEGFRSGQNKNLATLGEDIMFMFPGRVPAVPGNLSSAKPYRFNYSDYLAIRNEAHHVGALSPVIERDDIRALSAPSWRMLPKAISTCTLTARRSSWPPRPRVCRRCERHAARDQGRAPRPYRSATVRVVSQDLTRPASPLA